MKELLSVLEQKAGSRKDGISDERLYTRMEELKEQYRQASAALDAFSSVI